MNDEPKFWKNICDCNGGSAHPITLQELVAFIKGPIQHPHPPPILFRTTEEFDAIVKWLRWCGGDLSPTVK